MHETATLHFDLSHLAPDQPFTLHVGSSRYDLAPHTRQTLTRARRSNSALGLMRDDRITHFTGPVRLPGNAPVLLRVTAPAGLVRDAEASYTLKDVTPQRGVEHSFAPFRADR